MTVKKNAREDIVVECYVYVIKYCLDESMKQ